MTPTPPLNEELVSRLAAEARRRDRRFVRPFCTTKTYRGRERCIVGYTWTRPYASPVSGWVYDAVVSYGDTMEEAIEKAAVEK